MATPESAARSCVEETCFFELLISCPDVRSSERTPTDAALVNMCTDRC